MGRRSKLGAVALVLVSVAMACSSGSGGVGGNGTKLNASDFNQTCTKSSDCTLVAQGECAPPCGYGAIRKDESARYTAEQKRIRELAECQNQADYRCAQPPPALCDNGTCKPHPSPPPVSASDFDRSCATKADCTVIFEYAGTCAGGCAFQTIAKKDLEKYQAKARPYTEGCTTATQGTMSSCPAFDYDCTGGLCTGCAIGSSCPKDAGTD